MEVYFTILTFIYGLLLGSFYNVVGYRLPNNLSIVKPGSFCPKCNHELKWYELIPVLSFVIQRGKCRKCGCRISLFYPFIELLTGILFAVSYIIFGFSLQFIIAILISSFLVITIVSDFSYLIIPDEVTLFISITSILAIFIMGGTNLALSSIVFGVILFLFVYLIMFIGSKIMKEEVLGGGDVKLMFFVGVALNVIEPISFSSLSSLVVLFNGFFEIFLSSCLAAPFALLSYFSKKKRIIPFGPFILTALLIMFLISFSFPQFCF